MSKKIFLKGTLILACTGLISRIAGFFYRIFLSHAIGAEGLGLYQLVLPLQGLMAALSYTGIQSALSRLIASRLALQEKKEARFSLVTGTLMAVFFSATAGFLLFQHAYFFASAILKTPQTAGLLRITAVSIPLCAIHSCIDSYYYARKKASVPAAVQLSEQSGRFPCRRDCRFAGVAAGSFLSFRKSPCTRKDSRQDLSADKGPFHTVFSHFPEQDPSDTSRQHRSGPDPTDASAFRHDSLRLTEDLWDLYRNGTAPAPVSFHTYVFRRCNADAFHRTA